MVIQGSKGIFDPVSALSSKRASPYPIFSIPHPPHLSTSSTLAHTPSLLTSPAPEPPAKHPIYRSIFRPMRTAAKPAIPYTTTTSSPCQQGFPRLEGLRRRHHLPASHLQGAGRQHCAVPQRGTPHTGGAAAYSGISHQRRLHRAAHQSADPDGGLYHRPHRTAVPGGDTFGHASTIALQSAASFFIIRVSI